MVREALRGSASLRWPETARRQSLSQPAAIPSQSAAEDRAEGDTAAGQPGLVQATLGPPLQPGGPGESRRGGQGFRRLWQAVTQVGRGEKLGGAGDSTPFAETTVEDLLKVIRALSPEASAPKAIAQGLYYLDSGALAALLKVRLCPAISRCLAASPHVQVWLVHPSCGFDPSLTVFDLTATQECKLYLWASHCDGFGEAWLHWLRHPSILQELAKTGQLRRSIEIFDWLRGLENGHELAPLADVYTYTTSISQCGSHQQLRRALELVAEMRSRGIPCNVHTYR